MNFFNQINEDKLNTFFDSTDNFKLIILWGAQGAGKTFLVHSVLQESHIKIKDIIFSEDNIVPFDLPANISSPFYNEADILIYCSKLFSDDYCLCFQNMELCDLDSQRIIHRLLKYHKRTEQKACIILEYNLSHKPDDMLCSLTENFLHIGTPNKKSFEQYYTAHFDYTPETKTVFEKMIQISNGNIQEFLTTINLLEYIGVLHKDGKRLIYNPQSEYKLPDSLFNLYMDVFDNLKVCLQEPLVATAPFSKKIYNTLIRAIYNNYDRFEIYLETLCEKGCFIFKDTESSDKNTQYFHAHFSFIDEKARKAIVLKTNQSEIDGIVAKYYNHLDQLYFNKQIYDNLHNTDKILLLSKLTQKRQNTLKINQIDYIVELMKSYYCQFMYLNAIKQGERLLESQIVNITQLNDICHLFWNIYFKSLLAVGDYEKILGYKNRFEDEDLNFCIAVAFYNYGQPEAALELLKEKLYRTVEYKGDVHNLTASIYDWIGNNKKSVDEFKKALAYADNDRLKYQLYKKYSMYIDFRILECREKLKCAIYYYKKYNLKQYAECLHNYGSGCVFIRDFSEAQKYLEAAVDTLNKCCANEIYYPLNSLAILYCYDSNQYERAFDILKRALKCDIDIAFCELALHNNLFNIIMHMGNLDAAKAEKNVLETLFKKERNNLKDIPKERPDIQHQLRQFYYNCAVLCKIEGNNAEALNFFIKAKECSCYHSNIIYSIDRNIIELKEDHGKKNIFEKIKKKKRPSPTELESYIHKNDLYLCEIMFWG